jgi:hypothetical protein
VEGARQVVDRVESPDGDDEVVGCFGRVPLVFDYADSTGGHGEQRSGIGDVDGFDDFSQPIGPAGVRAA